MIRVLSRRDSATCLGLLTEISSRPDSRLSLVATAGHARKRFGDEGAAPRRVMGHPHAGDGPASKRRGRSYRHADTDRGVVSGAST